MFLKSGVYTLIEPSAANAAFVVDGSLSAGSHEREYEDLHTDKYEDDTNGSRSNAIRDSAWNGWRAYDESIISTTPKGSWKPSHQYEYGSVLSTQGK